MKNNNGRILHALLMALCFCVSPAKSEVFQDIQPYDTLGDLRKKFPNAEFTQDRPAWAREGEAAFTIKGYGLPGQIFVVFSDLRPGWKKTLEAANSNEAVKEMSRRYLEETDDEALTVQALRWIPRQPMPLENLIAKYGKPDTSGFDDSLAPYSEWKKGLRANLDGKRKMVLGVEYSFTNVDRCRVLRERIVNEKTNQKIPMKACLNWLEKESNWPEGYTTLNKQNK